MGQPTLKAAPAKKTITLYFLDNLAESFLIESFMACIEVLLKAAPDFLPGVFCTATFTVSCWVESITPVVLVFESIMVVDVESTGCFFVLSPQAASDKTAAATKAALMMFFIMFFLLGVYKL